MIVFGSSSSKSDSQIDTSNFVKKSYLKTNYIQTNMDEGIDLKNQFYIKNLLSAFNLDDAISKRFGDTNYLKISNYDNDSIVRNKTHINFNNITLIGLSSIYLNQDPEFDLQVSTKQYVDNKFNDSSLMKNTDHIDFKDHNLTNVRFVQVNSYPAINSHLTCKEYVDNNITWAVDNSSLLRLDPNENLETPNQDYITLNSAFTSPQTKINIPINNQHLVRNNQDNDFNNYRLTYMSSVSVTHDAVEDQDLVTLGYVKSLHENNEQNRRDIGLNFYDEKDNLVKNNQTNDFNDNIILNVQSIEINDEYTSDNHAANKSYVDNIITHESLILKNTRKQIHTIMI